MHQYWGIAEPLPQAPALAPRSGGVVRSHAERGNELAGLLADGYALLEKFDDVDAWAEGI
jgi:hypothetical protein